MAVNLLAGKNLLAPPQEGDPWDQDIGDPWDDDLPKQPVNLLAKTPQPSFGEQTMVALKQGFNSPGDLINRAATGVAGTIANMMGKEDARDKMFQTMEEELKASQQWSNPNNIEPGVLPSILGTLPNLPAQMATFPLAPFETGQEMIKRGETLPRAQAGAAITTGMNAIGIAAPAALPLKMAGRMASGAAINAMQTAAQQLSLQAVSQTKEGKEAYKLKPQDIAVAGVLGAGFGAMAKPKAKVKPIVDPVLDTKVDEFFAGKTTTTEGRLGGEVAGEVDMALWNKNKEQQAAQQQQAYADALEAQRVSEAEVYAAQQYPEQSTTGLSTGEGSVGGKVINRSPVTDSGLMGLPQRPVEPPVGLSTGEGLSSVRDPSRPMGASNLMGAPEGPRVPPVGLSLGEDTPGGAIINRPAGPSNLMGEPIPPVAGPVGLSTGEGAPGGRVIQRTPETSSGLMGVEPKPFDPFGSIAGRQRIGKFRQGGAIHPQLAEDVYKLGKSVMRGANGLLKLFYHGATRPIEGPFKKSPFGDLGQAVYVTDDPAAAGRFAMGIRGSNTEPQLGGNTHPVYLNSENNFNNASFVGNADWQQYLKSLIEPIAKRAFEYESQPWFKKHVDQLLTDLENNQAKVEDLFTIKASDHKGDKYTSVSPWSTDVSNAIKNAGWQSLELNDGRYHQVAVFDPENVKDALNPTNGINKFGQGGQAPIIGDLAEGIVRLGGLLKGKKTGQVVLPPDSLAEPRSPEMVKTKLEKSAKAKAIGLKGTVYDSPGSIEELRANPGKDIGFTIDGKERSPGQFLGSGAEAVVRRNTSNNSTKYVRGLYSKARNLSENLVHKYVTGPNALTSALRELDSQEKLTAYQLVQKLSKERQNYTPELADHLGLSTAVRNYMDVRQAAFKGQFDFSASVNAKLGFKQFEELGGYSPTNFDSAYRTLVYEVVVGKDGKEQYKIVAPVTASSLWEHNKGVELYKERNAQRVKEGKTPYKLVELPVQGLKKNTSPNKQFDAMATMLAKMAELDPRFAEAKKEVDSLIAEQTKKYMSFNVHELHKKGVEGGIGNRPWLTLERNADDFFKMEIDHLDSGFRYWSYQDAITKTRQFVTDPSIEHPNAKRWAEQYTKRIAGQKLNPLGGMLNWTIDLIQTPMGLRGSKNAYNALGAARAVGNAWLMGIWNPMFMVVQSSQLIVNGLTEAARMRVDLDIPHSKMATALPNAVAAWTYLTAMDKTGRWDKAGMFGDLKDDFKWAQEHGLSTYSEVALSHEAAMDPKMRLAKDIAMHPTTLPEYFTRPTTFLWYTQMFREAGYTGEQARIAARDATDYAMTNYHADELPMMYKDLGVSGKNIGSLRAFVHNNTDQFIARAMEANKYPAAFGTMMGMTLLLQGITGVVGYGLANELSMAFTDKTLTEWMEELLEPQNRKYLNGFVSAWTDADIQSRFSTADVLPGSFAEGIVGPQISKFGKVLVAGYEYGKNQDQASLLKLGKEVTPSGMAGIFEDKLLTDEQGFVLKDGERKYKEPRTQGERDLRRQYNTRPLRERMEDESLYRDNQRMAKMTEKQRNAFERMKTAHILNDKQGEIAARQKFREEGGNIEAIGPMLERAKVDALKSARERKQGEVTDSLSSIQRFKNYQE